MSATAARQGWPSRTPFPLVPIAFLSGGILGKQILAVQTSHLWLGPKSSVTQQNQSSSAHGSVRCIQACICSISGLLVFHQDLAIPVLPINLTTQP